MNSIRLFLALILSVAILPCQAAVVKSLKHSTTAYCLHDSPARLVRYDLSSRQWLSDLLLPVARGTATTCLVDSDGIYVAYGTSVYRYNTTGGAETHLVNAPQTVQALHSDGNLLFVNHSSGLHARFISINKTTNTQIATFENYVDSVYGSSIAPSVNKIFGRTQGISPSDISFVSYTDLGTFSSGGASPYHGEYASATKTWVFPNEARVVDDSGTAYSTQSLGYAGSFGGSISDVDFYGVDIPIVLRASQLSSFTSTMLPAGSKSLSYSPFGIFVNGSDVITFTVDVGEATGIRARIEPVADLGAPTPGLPVNPVGLAFTPDLVFQDINGVVCLLHKNSQSIFRWSPTSQQFLTTIPLIGIPSYAAYSPSMHRVYLAYASGLVRKIDLSDTSLTEVPFYMLPSAPLGLATAGQYLFAVDESGAWNTHYTVSPEGQLVDSVDWNYYSAGFTWSDTNQKMYFFRDDTSPNDILWEEINANGTAYPGEVQGGIRNKIDSPYHGEDYFVHPIQVAPNGSVVITGTGKLFNATTLVRQTNVLPNAIADAAWIGSELRTIRTITGVTQYQQWTGETYAAGLVKQYPGTAHRLLTHAGNQHIGISVAADGRPSFYLLDSSFEVVSPASLAQPTLIATSSVGASQVVLGWADISGETAYLVERKTGSGGTWDQIGTTTVSVSTFTDTTVTTGNMYFYRVAATNGSLVSPSSDELAVFIMPPPATPTLVINLNTYNQIVLAWTNVAFENGYVLERAPASTGPWTVLSNPEADATSFTDNSVIASTLYHYRIKAVNTAGSSSYYSTSATTPVLVGEPGEYWYNLANSYYAYYSGQGQGREALAFWFYFRAYGDLARFDNIGDTASAYKEFYQGLAFFYYTYFEGQPGRLFYYYLFLGYSEYTSRLVSGDPVGASAYYNYYVELAYSSL